jgi:hypothetical protein
MTNLSHIRLVENLVKKKRLVENQNRIQRAISIGQDIYIHRVI